VVGDGDDGSVAEADGAGTDADPKVRTDCGAGVVVIGWNSLEVGDEALQMQAVAADNL
jgi:hypothetical protein